MGNVPSLAPKSRLCCLQHHFTFVMISSVCLMSARVTHGHHLQPSYTMAESALSRRFQDWGVYVCVHTHRGV